MVPGCDEIAAVLGRSRIVNHVYLNWRISGLPSEAEGLADYRICVVAIDGHDTEEIFLECSTTM